VGELRKRAQTLLILRLWCNEHISQINRVNRRLIASLALALIAKDDFKVHHLGSVALSGGDYYWICNLN
jgi:hypothetical protein